MRHPAPVPLVFTKGSGAVIASVVIGFMSGRNVLDTAVRQLTAAAIAAASARNHPRTSAGHRPGPRHITGQGPLPRTQRGPNYVSVM